MDEVLQYFQNWQKSINPIILLCKLSLEAGQRAATGSIHCLLAPASYSKHHVT